MMPEFLFFPYFFSKTNFASKGRFEGDAILVTITLHKLSGATSTSWYSLEDCTGDLKNELGEY
jgi:hypothetical protein